ncbi:hypothetical protein GVO57_04070 [Sphingomonas changnyeongensis]|uniref:Flagella basal body P-ring formation protein FlgA SAF domain-containing protein n=1 Tax=Sphingomonas changnyeongensis TaxID=2698679 RepID=A0A7Z2NVJ9_9SPHN|nr:flagella basal body P-ring formation protein FlgA [Sphingomonas changnyeongensis]QHL90160.1 hypothetical protein GVO57_04070 [Sphingomonas changnyeongensis]
MLSLLLTVLAAPSAPAITDLAVLDRAAEIFAGARLGEAGGPVAPIDRRLRLQSCPSSPEFAWRTPAHDAIVIRCPEAGGWRIFVAVRQAAANGTAAGPAASPVPRVAEPVIRRGDPVTLASEQPGFSVSAEAVAMADAAPGARVAVKVEGARTPVQAIAVAPGRAMLPPR